MPTLAQMITMARKAQGLTQEGLAKVMHVSRQTVSHWENGHTVPDFETIR